MRMTPETVRAKLAPLVGEKGWGASLGVGSFLTLEFGSKIKASGGYVHGEWHLWIYYCAWRIERGPRVLAASEDDRPLIKKTVALLNGKTLTEVRVTSPMMDTLFAFEGALALKTFGIYSQDAEHWMLFTPDQKVLTIGPGTTASFKPASKIKNHI
jgi:hypothetical protein